MNLKHLFFRKAIKVISQQRGRCLSHEPILYRKLSTTTFPLFTVHDLSPKTPKPSRYFHSDQKANHDVLSTKLVLDSNKIEDDDTTMNQFLSHFVWIMRGKLSDVYPDCDKKTIDSMLLIIVEKVVSEVEKGGFEQILGASSMDSSSHDLSDDLWKTVWEVSNKVLDEMQKARKKEKMKTFLQCEEVKEMYRFATEAGVCGDLLRELRFKWAREKMEEDEFYKGLERLKQEESQAEAEVDGDLVSEEKPKDISLPKRHGKINYKIYGLDLSDPTWAEVADKIHDTEEANWPQDPKPITGKCKLVTEKILSLKEDDDPSVPLAEWIELLQPNRADWMALLDKLKDKDASIHLKVGELVLDEESFQTNVTDYSKLVEVHSKANRLHDAERILKKMNEKGFQPDTRSFTTLVHTYSKAGNLERAKEAFESLRIQGFRPDVKIYNSMIMAYVNAGQPKMGESLLRELESRDLGQPLKEIYLLLLRSFSQIGDIVGSLRMSTAMQFAGFEPDLESCTLLVEAYSRYGNSDQARSNFDYMVKLGFKPDDRCTAAMITAYEKNNSLDKGLELLLELEKDGFEPGILTYSALVDWFGKLQLVNEVEAILSKISIMGEAPPFKVHVSLCDMYARSGSEKKALQALETVEAKYEQLSGYEFERIISGLINGGFNEDAKRMHGLMQARGFVASDKAKINWISVDAFSRKGSTSFF
ncbi:pentatricopeptide repeat-containing protein At2g35130 [Impatiens glandulifera]|uniref:pentatricopeptide repeat-containing protein At2g35130 n=1 Tax=Impatiens glandulifera TaxID=253017 RepID=UPI001FB13145|nr:pentatricopeptide repeat-containing protein At2g35130 [Impatiens glandulifera]